MLQDFFNSPDLSDLALKVGDKTLHTHSQLLSLVSPYFRARLEPHWNPQNDAQGSKILEVTLPKGTSYSLLEILFGLIYNKIQAEASDATLEALDVESLISLSALAEEYLIKYLTEKLHKLIRLRFGTIQAVRIYLFFKNRDHTETHC